MTKYNFKLALTITYIFFFLSIFMTLAQMKEANGNEFSKTIEPAMIAHGLHNTKSKSALQKKLTSDENATLEFYVNPSFKGAYGLSLNSVNENDYLLEISWVFNWKEVMDKLDDEYPLKSIKAGESFKLTKEEVAEMARYNGIQTKKMYAEAFKEYETEMRTLEISENFAEQFHNTYVQLIKSYVNIGIPRRSRDGYTAAFRCVVGDEVWNFVTKNPKGVFKELTNICNQIVTDVQENGEKIDEDKYIKLLKELVE